MRTYGQVWPRTRESRITAELRKQWAEENRGNRYSSCCSVWNLSLIHIYISEEQKQDAINGMIALTDMAEKETAAEILLEAKGFNDVVVSISGSGVDVVVNAPSLTDAQRAQIEDIVTRKTGITPENIIISPITGN